MPLAITGQQKLKTYPYLRSVASSDAERFWASRSQIRMLTPPYLQMDNRSRLQANSLVQRLKIQSIAQQLFKTNNFLSLVKTTLTKELLNAFYRG